MIARQTTALFVDAYRELNAKKLFWITMGLSLLLVLVFAALGLDKDGITFLHWAIPSEVFNSNVMDPSAFYGFAFSNIGVPIWLAWGATILALISTAGIVPDFISGGSIELALAKPIGRVRLFLTKYVTGLLFVGLQVGVFTVAATIVVGVRGDEWRPSMLLAIPIVLLFFSYLFSICVLLGLITRSTIASLLITILVWLAIFVANSVDGFMIGQRAKRQVVVARQVALVERQEQAARDQIERMRAQGQSVPGEDGIELPPGASDALEAVNPFLAGSRARMAEQQDLLANIDTWSQRVYYARTVLPKTSDTIGLLDRYVVSDATQDAILQGFTTTGTTSDDDEEVFVADNDFEVQQTAATAARSRSVWWIVGTSLLFEGAMLGVCLVIFVRRDF